MGNHLDVVVDILDCDIKVSKFKPQSCYYIHFWAYILGKDLINLILPALA